MAETVTDFAGPRVAIIFPNLKGNIGDFAILDAMLRVIERQNPGAARDVFLPGKKQVDAERTAAFIAAGAPSHEVVGTTWQPPEGRHWSERIGMRRYAQDHAIRALAAANSRDAARFEAYDAIYIAGGDQWNGRQLGRSMFGSLEAVAAVNPAIRAFPFSVHPRIVRFNTPAALMRLFGRINAPLPVRDSISRTLLSDLGLPVADIPDCVFSLAPVAEAVAAMQGRDPDRILFAATGSAEDLRGAVGALRGEGPVEVLTTCVSEDDAAYRAIAAEFDIPYRTPLTWQETVAEFKSARILVTNRLHGLILGSLSDALLLPIADRKKAEAFALDTGTPCIMASLAKARGQDVQDALASAQAVKAATRAYRDAAVDTLARTRF